MTTKNIIISLIVILVLGATGFAYWYFMLSDTQTVPLVPTRPTSPTGFQPIGTVPPSSGSARRPTPTPTAQATSPIASLRLISNTPVGGFAASTTGSTTILRWVDRGRGNVYQIDSVSIIVQTISNTVVPRIYKSVWNKNLTAFVGSLFEADAESVSTVFAQIMPRSLQTATSTQTSLAPYELKGRNIDGEVIDYAVSPDRSKLFTLKNENGSGVGYVSTFAGEKTVKLFTSPLTQVSVDWPSDNIISVTTKGSAKYPGYMYFVDAKSGNWKKLLGPIKGLSAKANSTGKYILYSESTETGITTSILNVSTGLSTDALIDTLADKCAWGRFYRDMAYCAVPNQASSGIYPDDWYLGTLSTSDRIWQVNAATSEVNLLSSLIESADRIIDAFNLATDEKDNFLFFMNKNDLSLWSLDLVGAR